jgi:Relaxase/Mobilisation nuclease domain
MAAHLSNTFDNDRVEVADLRGAVAPDLAGAFSEWHAQAKGTKAKKYLYSLSLNPDPRQGPLTRDQYFDFIARVEARLKLGNQPRAVVFHVKHGREHAHVVWSRIDTANMKAIPISHDHQTLRSVAQQFAKDHGLELPDSMKKNQGKERYEQQKKTADLAEKQQEERSGISKSARMATITEAWNSTKNGEELIRALAAKDYIVAHGDKRGYVVVDLAGEIHSLSRQIKGANTADVRGRLAGIAKEKIPAIAKAVDNARQILEERQRMQRAESSPAQPGPTADERRSQLQNQQLQSRNVLKASLDEMRLRQAREAGKLTIEQATANADVARGRIEFRSKGISGLFMKVYGLSKVADLAYKFLDKDRLGRQKADALALEKNHKLERGDLTRQLAALQRVQKRERMSLETTIKREEFQRAASPARERGTDGKDKGKSPALSAEQAARLAEMQAVTKSTTGKTVPPRKASDLNAAFNRAVDGKAKATPTNAPTDDGQSRSSGQKPGSLRDAFADAVKAESPGTEESIQRASSLAEEFRRAAQKRAQDRGLTPDADLEKQYRKAPADRSVRR